MEKQPAALIVDDDEVIAQLLSHGLKDYGLNTIYTTNFPEARYLLSIQNFNVIIADPLTYEKGKSSIQEGIDFFHYVQDYYPGSHLIALSGYAPKKLLTALSADTPTPSVCLRKPCTMDEIINVIADKLAVDGLSINRPKENPIANIANIRIFICYGRQDEIKAMGIFRVLKQQGYSPWIDKENLLPGQDWEEEIEKAIDESHFFIACLSNHSVSKEGYVQKELRLGLDKLSEKPESSIYLIPIRLDDCPVPRKFMKLHRFDMFRENNVNKLYAAINESAKQRGIV